MSSLPTSNELIKSAQSNDEATCGSQVLQILTHGTSPHASLASRKEEACKILSDAFEDCIELEDVIVDNLWLRGTILASSAATAATPPAGGDADAVGALADIIKVLTQIPDRPSFVKKLQNNLIPSLIEAACLGSEQDVVKRLKMHNTNVNYKQQKYNLLQEESEGYSKVLQFLLSSSDDSLTRRNQLRQIMGTFELDPNRVMDLTLEALESKLFPNGSETDPHPPKKPEKSKEVIRLLEIMKEFSLDKLPSLVSFKMGPTPTKEASKPLLYCIALLTTEGILDFESLLQNYFSPIEKQIAEAHKILWTKEKRRIQALSRISLSGTIKEDPKVAELTATLEKALMELTANPLVSILLIRLQWREWESTQSFVSLQTWKHLCDLYPKSFGFALCDIAMERLEPWYKSKVSAPGLLKPFGDGPSRDAEMSNDVGLQDIIGAVAEPLLMTVNSGCISERPVFYCQLCRVLASIIKEQEGDVELSQEAYDFFAKFMVPCLTLFPSNPAISTELWYALEKLPYTTRYRLYEDWKGSGLERAGLGMSPTSSKPLPVVECEMAAGKAARYALKRLSKDNIRDMSRQLAKVTHSCPLVVYGTILSQIESYDNMVEVMVEAQRFSNLLGLDVLGFSILSRLSGTTGGVNRSRLKEDGVNVSQWLQSLEAFAGAFFKRCPFVEFRGILAYLMRRLQDGNVMELGILRTLLKVPGGYGFADYSPVASLSRFQLQGRAGSLTLKRETVSFGIAEDINHQASEKIKEVLRKDGFGASMLILVSQARSHIIFEASKGSPKPVKLVGNLYDSCQVVMSILLEFLTSENAIEEPPAATQDSDSIAAYAKELPSLEDLYSKFGFDIPTTWMLSRPLIRASSQADSTDVVDELKRYQIDEEFRQSYQGMLSDTDWAALTKDLFEKFYTLALSDIFHPNSVYEAELNRIAKEVDRLEKLKSNGSSQVTKEDTAELSRLKTVSTSLTKDAEAQKEHVSKTLDTWKEAKDTLFASTKDLGVTAKAFFTHCVFPRSLQGPEDAMYSSQFALSLHEMKTPGFSTLHYIDELISVASGSLFGLTEEEAASIAILLWETWKVVNKWRYEEALFEKEMSDQPGSFMKRGEEEASAVKHKEYIELYNTWHASLGSALIGCLKSSEYMHMRSGLLVLTRIVEVFPTRPRLGNKLFTALEPLQDENLARPDIRASANAYGTMLMKARDDGKWIEEDASVAKARADKEKAAAEERKKKLEKQFKELQRDSEKITEEIGPRDRFERRRDGREPPSRGGEGSANPGGERSRSGGGPASSNRETGEVSRDHRDLKDRRSPERRRDRDDRGRNETASGRGQDRHSSERNRRDTGDRGGRGDEVDRGGLGGRWVRGTPVLPSENSRGGNRGGKRGRGSSPEPITEERAGTKRPRLDGDSFDSRRDAGRGSSPSRRGRGAGPESSRGSWSRRSRR